MQSTTAKKFTKRHLTARVFTDALAAAERDPAFRSAACGERLVVCDAGSRYPYVKLEKCDPWGPVRCGAGTRGDAAVDDSAAMRAAHPHIVAALAQFGNAKVWSPTSKITINYSDVVLDPSRAANRD